MLKQLIRWFNRSGKTDEIEKGGRPPRPPEVPPVKPPPKPEQVLNSNK